MARSSRTPARLVVALAVAAVLAIFLVYTALSGTTPALQPSNLAGPHRHGLADRQGDRARSWATRTGRRACSSSCTTSTARARSIPIVYHGSVPDLFKVGRDVNLTGRMQGGSFVATALTTKCPSKYTAHELSAAPMADLGRAALVVSFGLALYALVGGTAAAITRQRRLADSARYALIACFGSTVIASGVLIRALVQHDFTYAYVAGAHEPRPLDDLLADRVLGRGGGLAAALAARAHRLRRRSP